MLHEALVAHVTVGKIERRIGAEMKEAILLINQTVDDVDVKTSIEQVIAEYRAEVACSASDEHARHRRISGLIEVISDLNILQQCLREPGDFFITNIQTHPIPSNS